MTRASCQNRALALFRRHGGMMRTTRALRSGIHPRTLYALRDAGRIVALTRGHYRLASLSPLGYPDLVVVAAAVPKGVIALVSALAFHKITTQIPHQVDLALERRANRPRLSHPPLRVFWFSGAAFSEGIETHRLDGVAVRIYSAAKTVVDCFKYRHKLGLDIALEALRLYQRGPGASVDDLMRYARVCRVRNILRPYLEALL